MDAAGAFDGEAGPPPNPGVGYPAPYEPGPFETAIEFPYALFIAPVVFGSAGPSSLEEVSPGYSTFFTSRAKPLLHDGISDLWTAALGRSNTIAGIITHAPTPPPQVAAVWASSNANPPDVIYYQPPPIK